MTALAASRVLPTAPRGRLPYDLLATQQVWGGGLVGVTAAGFLIPWDNIATSIFIGVCLEDALEPTQDVAKVDDSGTVVKNIPVASAVQGSVGLEVYCTTDNVMTDCVLNAAATSRAIGRIARWRSATDCDIELYSAAEWAVRYNIATT